ncbi:SWI5-like protein [Saccharomyces kudriavzevii IFO 1802]|uniref:SWI5-like protein n=1 Tax=Saccharomyces kudriavzevii (strain ATCC MYA-4449 / AS 2.2408 / CBS 8840 / NBRC 1802 / NCYC 2889) TaxID=226230 RepID=J6ED63_SACK1|nr:SWI5-like protein [Saccharomyces kudriavzevii IFO 1802]
MDTSNSWFDVSKVQNLNFDLHATSCSPNSRSNEFPNYSVESEYKTLATDDFSNILNLNYGEANEMIMSEIKDLSLPLGPLSDDKSVKVSAFPELTPNYWQSMNFGLENNPKEASVNTAGSLKGIRSNQDAGVSTSQKKVGDISEDWKRMTIPDNLLAGVKRNELDKGFDRNLGELLLQQQQELRQELRAQQEANKKLELELKETQFKQQQLQATLEGGDSQQFLSPQKNMVPALANVEDVYANSLSQ